jgi:DNA-3-methyladenine glycosylase I
MEKRRCPWASGDDFYIRYHDEEWGVPVHDDGRLFEFLVLEGFQAGLSWHCVLKKRPKFRKDFDGFDPAKVAEYGPGKVAALMKDAGIIRNRAKIEATISNARAFLKAADESGSFSDYIWGFVGGKPIVNKIRDLREMPAKTPLAERISADLKARGFRFVGPTIVYAHMQATGMVNDHVVSCPRWKEVQQ